MRLPQDEGIDPTQTIQGHVDGQQLRVLYATLVHERRGRKRSLRERVIADNHGNLYLHYTFEASDGELYDVSDWVRPSVIAEHGGFSDDLKKLFRDKAFAAWDAVEEDLRMVREVLSNLQRN